MDPKQYAAERAIQEIESGMLVGLGTGSTASLAITLLGTALREDRLTNIIGVPTSIQTERAAQAAGIPLRALGETQLDLTFDGADEVDPALQLIKGRGGALLREKLVAINSRRVLIMVDESKLVSRLGTHTPLPVEIEPFGQHSQLAFLRELGTDPYLRLTSSGEPFITDGGHMIYDCHFRQGIADAAALQSRLQSRVGIVAHGLFLGIADLVIVGSEQGVRLIQR